jgi:hypothetical protein
MKIVVVSQKAFGLKADGVQETIGLHVRQVTAGADLLCTCFQLDIGQVGGFAGRQEIKRLADDLARFIEERGSRQVVLGWSETIGIGHIVKAAQHGIRHEKLSAMRRQFTCSPASRRHNVSILQQDQFDVPFEGLGRFIDGVKVQAIQSFVRNGELT